MTSPDGGDVVRLRDEILELLYWLEGEKFGAEATIDGLGRFLAFSQQEIRTAVDRLIALGEVVDKDGVLALTNVGHREAARRFADDFGPYLKQGHGECNDPECECHLNPDAAVDCHRRTVPPTEHAH